MNEPNYRNIRDAAILLVTACVTLFASMGFIQLATITSIVIDVAAYFAAVVFAIFTALLLVGVAINIKRSI